LLPAKYGGLDSPNVVVVDAGNKSDVYLTVNFARQYGMDYGDTLNRIIVSRTFTIYPLKSLLSRELPKVVQKYQARIVVISRLLDLFNDPNVKQKEAKKLISRVMLSLTNTSSKVLIITSMPEANKYTSPIASEFGKRISLSNSNRGRLDAKLYNLGRQTDISLTERELKIIPKK
jgi:hypothetical protein